MSKFSQEKTKYNTARVVVWNDFQVTNSFTLETSMFSKMKIMHHESKQKTWGEQLQLVEDDFKSIGCNLVKAILQFILIEQQLEKEFKQTGGWLKRKMLDEFAGITAREKQKQEAILAKQATQVLPSTKKPVVLKKSQRNLTLNKLMTGDTSVKSSKQSEIKQTTIIGRK